MKEKQRLRNDGAGMSTILITLWAAIGAVDCKPAAQITPQEQRLGIASCEETDTELMDAAAGADASTLEPVTDEEFANLWVTIATSSTGTAWAVKGRDLSAAPETVRRVWVKQDHSRDRTVKARQTMGLKSVDCSAQTLKDLSYVEYDAGGRVLASGDMPVYQTASPIVPGSMGEALADAICRQDR